MSAEKKIALVTGASKGIGEALVRELITRGWLVVGVARSQDKLEKLAHALGEEVFLPYVCDVSDAQSVRSVTAELIGKGLIPSLFFLNAGIAGKAACESPADFRTSKHQEIFATNYFGVLHWVEEWVPTCRKTPGATFVVTSSLNAFFAPPIGAAYAASKAAVAKTFEALSLEYHHSPLNFLVAYPGPVDTDGLVGKFPFTWTPERMANRMVTKALKKQKHIQPQLFYSIIIRMLRWAPAWCVARMFKT